ncbi:MAG: hypothetical protein SOZ47_02095 [Lawsonibacter sp.]|nr:hypothetical protein [Lawsonibacter sp.]
MVKSFKYLLQFAWINLGAILGFAAIVIAGAYLTGVPQGANNLFRTYFGTFPLLTLIMLFLFSYALCTSNLNLALSFGARRRDFFFAIQGVLLLYAGVCWALQAVMSAIPDLFGWTSVDRWSFLMSLGGLTNWQYPLACLTIMTLGCLCGLLYVRSKGWGVLVMVVTILGGIAATMVLLIFSDSQPGTPGALTATILTCGSVGVIAVCELLIWRTVHRFVVR